MENWKTHPVILEGGIVESVAPLVQGGSVTGSLIQGVNFEPAPSGYRRIAGYTKFDATEVPGSGAVLGVFYFFGKVVALRGADVYVSEGAGWTKINTDTRTAPGKARGTKYVFVNDTLTVVDGTNLPFKYDGTTYTVLTNAPVAATCATTFKNHLCLGKFNLLTISAPLDDNDYTAASGAIEINVGQDITGLRVWRDNLFIFTRSRILRMAGSSYTDFQIIPVANSIGCLHPDSIQEVGGDLWFLGPDGIRTVAGTDREGDFNLSSVSKTLEARFTRFTEAAATGNISSAIVATKNQYRIFHNITGLTTDIASGLICWMRAVQGVPSPEWLELRGLMPYCCDSDYNNEDEVIVHGGYDGYVYRQEQGNTFDSENIFAFLQTPYMHMDDPGLRKTLYKITAHIESEGPAEVNVGVLYDYAPDGVPQPPITLLASAGRTVTYGDVESIYDDTPLDTYDEQAIPQYTTNLEGSGRVCSFIFESVGASYPFQIKDFYIEYSVGGRS